MLHLKHATMTTEARAIVTVRGYGFCPDVILDRFRGAQFPSQKGRQGTRLHSSKSNAKFFKAEGSTFILAKTSFPVEKQEDEPGDWQQRVKLPIIAATRVKTPRFQSSGNEIENISRVCQTFCLLEQKVQQVCQTCQTCRFRNWDWGVNQTHIPNLPSLLFSELGPIKQTPWMVLRKL